MPGVWRSGQISTISRAESTISRAEGGLTPTFMLSFTLKRNALTCLQPISPAGNRDKNVVKCPCCESQLTFDADKRQVTVTELAA